MKEEVKHTPLPERELAFEIVEKIKCMGMYEHQVKSNVDVIADYLSRYVTSPLKSQLSLLQEENERLKAESSDDDHVHKIYEDQLKKKDLEVIRLREAMEIIARNQSYDMARVLSKEVIKSCYDDSGVGVTSVVKLRRAYIESVLSSSTDQKS